MDVRFTTRRGGVYFTNSVSSILNDAGFNAHIDFYQGSKGDSAHGDSITFADYYRITDPVSSGVLIPSNESVTGVNWLMRDGMENAFDYFICQDDSVMEKLSQVGVTPSCCVSFPFVSLPDYSPQEGRSRPIKFFIPRYGNWTDERIKRLFPCLVKSIYMDIGSLDACEFVVDTSAFHYVSRYGEKVSFVDVSGKYIWNLMDSKIITCLGTQNIMEIAFISSLSKSKQLKTFAYSENIITNDSDENVDRVIDRFERSGDSYSKIRMWMVTNELIKDFGPSHHSVCNFASMLFGHSGVPVFSCDFGKMMELFENSTMENTDIIQIRQNRSRFDIVEKMSKIREQIHTARA